MYCEECGYEIKTNKSFCPQCGARLEADNLNVFGLRYYNGDETAFQEIYNDTEKWLRKYVYNRVISSDVEDCMQQIYIKLYQNIDKYNPEKGEFRAWFNTLVNNETISYMRKHMKPEKMEQVSMINSEDDSIIDFEAPVEFNPEVQIDKDETARLLREILGELSEEQRQCILLKYNENLKIKEIAEIMGISEGTVKSRLSYGLKKVEGKVLELEKQGVKLYSYQPAVFFIVLLSIGNPETITETGLLWGKVAGSIGVGNAAIGGASATSVATAVGSSAANAGVVAAGVAGKAIATKVAIGIVAALLTGGLAVGGVKLLSGKKEKKTATMTEAQLQTEEEVTTTEVVAIVDEASDSDATTEVVDEKTARYRAYYDVVKKYMAEKPTNVYIETTSRNRIFGVSYVDLIDINGDGNEQLMIVLGETVDESDCLYQPIASKIKLFDFIDGEAKELITLEDRPMDWKSADDEKPAYNDITYINFTPAGHVNGLVVCGDDNGNKVFRSCVVEKGRNSYNYKADTKFYEYINGEMKVIETLSCKFGDYASNSAEPEFYINDAPVEYGDFNKALYAYNNSDNIYIANNPSGGMVGPNEFWQIQETLYRKHEVIKQLATYAGDIAYVESNSNTECVFIVEDSKYDENRPAYNKYGECYNLTADNYGSKREITVSKDKKVFDLSDNYGDVAYEYKDDMLCVVGGKVLNDYFWLEGVDYHDAESYNPLDCMVTEEEYKNRLLERMNR